MARTTAASVSGSIFCPASCIAVLANPQAESPPGTTPGRRSQMSRICAQSHAMSRGERTPSAKTITGTSAKTSASSWTSLPPTDSVDRMSAPASAFNSNDWRSASQASPLRNSGGFATSRMSVGVTRSAQFSPLFSCASVRPRLRMSVSSAPHSGRTVIAGKSSNSSTSPGALRRKARKTTSRTISS